MTEYKSYRIIDGKAIWVIVDENERIINKEPKKEELKNLKDVDLIKSIYNKGIKTNGTYNESNTCENIKKYGKRCEVKLRPGNARRVYNDKGYWTGKWFCVGCNNIYYQKFNPNSTQNIIKSLRDRRLENQDLNHSNTKGDRFQKVTCELFEVEDLNVKYDNYIFPIDHSRHPTLGILQTKGRLFNSIEGWWMAKLEREYYKEFDNLIFYCTDRHGKIIERIYIIPKEEIIKRTYIRIYKENSRSDNPWYEKYRIKDDDILRRANEIYEYK